MQRPPSLLFPPAMARALRATAVVLAISVALGGSAAPGADAVPVEPKVAAASDEAQQAIAGFKVPDGWSVQLFAAEPDVANIVAFDIDNQGRVFVAESFRQNNGVTDNRGHDETWLLADLAAQTVQDRIDYHRRLLGDQVASYTQAVDRIRLLTDSDGDGRADTSRVFATGFNNLEEGTGAGVLARDSYVYYTCIPKLWKLIDADGDGRADERIVMSDGYGVRVAFRGHDMHGLILGPDGRLYFSIGDRGYHVITREGTVMDNPAVGAVFRCELDGSELEVFANGLRNPQELAFNDYGDLFTCDNNSDSGDRARIVHLLKGGDSGWRMYYQYLPDRGPFNREKLWHPFHEDQPAYIVPPVANFADGPSGLAYYPGTGFGDALKDTFLLADFRGGPANSGIRSFRLEAEGAFYRLADDDQPIWNILATDVAFGPDGAIWVSDWVNGWNGEGKGRLYRLLDPAHAETAEVAEVQKLLSGDWTALETQPLVQLLGHADRRVRLEAQWELARREAIEPLVEVVNDIAAGQLARLHAVWGLDQVVRHRDVIPPNVLEAMRHRLEAPDGYLRAAACQFLGDNGDLESAPHIRSLLKDGESRVRYFAALALGALADNAAADAVVEMLVDNDNRDPALRHAGVMALAQLTSADQLVTLRTHQSVSLRRAAVVALRRKQSEKVAAYLEDADVRVVEEAARAIHDQPIGVALDALAALIERPITSDAVLRRVLNANFRLGTAAAAESLAAYAARSESPPEMRLEALEMLGQWAKPDPRDRVLNDYRPQKPRPVSEAAKALRNNLTGILAGPEAIRSRAVSLAAQLGIKEVAPMIARRIADRTLPPAARAEALLAMVKLDPAAGVTAAREALQSSQAVVRVAALRVLADAAPREVLPRLQAAIDAPSVVERQTAFDLLARIDSPEARQVIADGVRHYLEGAIPQDTHLNLLEAAEGRLPPPLAQQLAAHRQQQAAADPLGDWLPSLHGGSADAGKAIFFGKTELSCVRCHKIGDQGGEVGPDLTQIGKTRDRRYLLESMVAPDAAIAEGFETAVIADDLGTVHTGIVTGETDQAVDLIKADASRVQIPKETIIARKKGKSAMPGDLTKLMSRRELRDLVAYLASLSTDPSPSASPAAAETEGHKVK